MTVVNIFGVLFLIGDIQVTENFENSMTYSHALAKFFKK